jgi:hypothetical protein
MHGAIRNTALILGCLAPGCSTMRPHHQYLGVTQPNANAVVREFPVSATLAAGRLTDIMTADPILENVELAPEASKEFRNFTKADREALGIGLLPPSNDVNYNIKARCKDGSPVGVVIRLKGESGSEVSVVYGLGGDPDLSRDLLDKLQAALTAPNQTPPKGQTAKAKKPEGSTEPR